MTNSPLHLTFGVVLNSAIFLLFLFGLGSTIIPLANIAIFGMWVILILSIVALFTLTEGSETSKGLNNRPVWYKVLATITGVATTLVVAANGFFVFAFIFIICDIMQGYHMWRSKT